MTYIQYAQWAALTPEPPKALTFITSSTAVDATNITIPASAERGDLLIFCNRRRNSASDPGELGASGWSVLGSTGPATNMRTRIFYKIAEASDPGSTRSNAGGADFSNGVILVYRTDNPIKTVTAGDYNGEHTGVNPSQQTLTTSGATAPLVIVACYGVNGTISFPEFQLGGSGQDEEDGKIVTSGGTDAYEVRHKKYDSGDTLEDATIDLGDGGGSNSLNSGYLRV